MNNNPITGARYFLRGLKLITRRDVRAYVVIPLSINVLLFGALIAFGANQFNALIEWFMPELPSWLQWLAWLLWVVFALAIALIVFYTFTLVANLISAPFNGYLAAAVERSLTGREPVAAAQPGIKGFAREVTTTLGQEGHKLVYLATRSLPVLVLFFIPGVNIAAPVIWLVWGAWMLALEYMDYPMGNHGIHFAAARQRLGEKRFMSLGFGAAAMLGTLIPGFNLLVIPVAVAGATAMWVDKFSQRESIPGT